MGRGVAGRRAAGNQRPHKSRRPPATCSAWWSLRVVALPRADVARLTADGRARR